MIFFNAVCDVKGCQALQAIYFEEDDETFGQVLKYLQAVGWQVRGSCQKDMLLVCPNHADGVEPSREESCPDCLRET